MTLKTHFRSVQHPVGTLSVSKVARRMWPPPGLMLKGEDVDFYWELPKKAGWF